METNWLQALIGVAAGVAGAAGTKAVSKKKGSTVHKIVSPLASVVAAIGAGAVQSSGVAGAEGAADAIVGGGLQGLAAVGLHILWKNNVRDRD